MDVVFGVVLVAVLVAVVWLFVESVSADRRGNRGALERLDRQWRSLMFRRCQVFRSQLGHEAAMRRVADRLDREAKP